MRDFIARLSYAWGAAVAAWRDYPFLLERERFPGLVDEVLGVVSDAPSAVEIRADIYAEFDRLSEGGEVQHCSVCGAEDMGYKQGVGTCRKCGWSTV
jgi:hypothetical protein